MISAQGYICRMPADVTILSREELVALYQERESLLAERESIIAEKDAQIARQHEILLETQEALQQKQFQIQKLQRMLFGTTRERFTPIDGQQVLPFFVDAERDAAAVSEAVGQEHETIQITYSRRRHPGRLPLPDHLPVVEVVHEPTVDTTGMRRIGEEITDELGYTPAQLFIRRHIRPKYVTAEAEDASQTVVIAPLPARVIDKCEASAELLVAITIEKHLYHMPIYRQIERFKAMGVRLPSSTVDGWQTMTGSLLRPLYAVMRALLPRSGYLQVDETPIAVQDRTLNGTTHRGYMWAYHAVIDRVIYFDYQRGRGEINCREMLKAFAGYLQTDAYVAYDQHKARSGITPLACWAHVRRKFFEARSNDQARAEEALALIGGLYDVERDARARSLTPDERKELRLERSLPLLNTIGKWLAGALEETTPKSPIGAAVRYAVGLWSQLENYLYDGHLEIDNNLIENAIRPLALGRKNYLFAGSHDAAVNIAMYRSFFATCRLHDVDAARWLLYVLTHIRSTPAEQYHTLLPQNIDRQLLG